MLTVLERAENVGGKPAWHCVCDCGNKKTASAKDIKRGDTQSCGCAYKLAADRRRPKHGCSRKGKMTPEYRVWLGMKNRCHNPSASHYEDYGGRGITVCERWLGEMGFVNFLADMGLRPGKQLSIERKRNDLGYSPENCVWADHRTQCRNRRSNVYIEAEGKKLCLMDWAKELGVDSSVIHGRISYLRKKNLPINLAIYREGETPLQRLAGMGFTIQAIRSGKI